MVCACRHYFSSSFTNTIATHVWRKVLVVTHLCLIWKELLQQLHNVLWDQGPVFVVGQAVVEHTQTLIPPDSHKARRLSVALRDGEKESVVDARQVSEVEDVVELGGGGRQIPHNSLVEFNGGCRDRHSKILHHCWNGRWNLQSLKIHIMCHCWQKDYPVEQC